MRNLSPSNKTALTLAAIGAFIAIGAAPALAAPIIPINNPALPGNLVFPSNPIHLSDLLPSGGVIPAVQVFDKIFYNFHYTTGGTSMPTAAAVVVTPVTTGIPSWGLEFSGAFADFSTPGSSDALITYEVAVADPTQFLISDAHIAGNPAVIGQGHMVITETWTPDVANQLIRVYDLEPGSTTLLSDGVDFVNPAAHLFVQKDIQAFVPNGDTGSVATLSFVDQTFSQTSGGTGRTPEPASLGLLMIGAASLVLRKRSAK